MQSSASPGPCRWALWAGAPHTTRASARAGCTGQWCTVADVTNVDSNLPVIYTHRTLLLPVIIIQWHESHENHQPHSDTLPTAYRYENSKVMKSLNVWNRVTTVTITGFHNIQIIHNFTTVLRLSDRTSRKSYRQI